RCEALAGPRTPPAGPAQEARERSSVLRFLSCSSRPASPDAAVSTTNICRSRPSGRDPVPQCRDGAPPDHADGGVEQCPEDAADGLGGQVVVRSGSGVMAPRPTMPTVE